MKTEMKKDTFWNRERVAKNISYKELTEILGGSIAGWGGRFSGQLMPNPLEIKHLCELFDIDLEKGTEEFKKAHALWKAERHKTPISITGTMENMSHPKKKVITVDMTAPQFEEKPVEEQPVIDIAEVLRSVYGKLPYETFMTFRSMIKNCTGDPIEFIYGKVSYKEFRQIQEALKDE